MEEMRAFLFAGNVTGEISIRSICVMRRRGILRFAARLVTFGDVPDAQAVNCRLGVMRMSVSISLPRGVSASWPVTRSPDPSLSQILPNADRSRVLGGQGHSTVLTEH